MAYIIAFSLLPFVQIGLSFYASGAVLLAIVMLLKWQSQIIAGALEHPIRTLACCVAFVMPMLYPAGVDAQDVQRALREVVIMVLMVAAFGHVGERMSREGVMRLSTLCCIIVAGYLVLAIIQAIFYTRQIYFGIPKDFFITNEGTLPGELDLIYSKMRPTGTFGEPSYLGFVLCSIGFALIPLADKWKMPRFAIWTIALIAIFIKSLSFFIAIVLLIAYARPGLKQIKITVIFPAIVVALGIGVLFWEILADFADRLMTISDQSLELSGYVRIFGPLSILKDYLSLYPTGVPFYKLYFVLEEYVPEGIRPLSYHDNGLLNFLFDFGLYGFLLMYFYFSSVKNNTSRIYLFACGIFNGALLSPDKLGIMILAISLYNSFHMFVVEEESRMPKPREEAVTAPSVATSGAARRRNPLLRYSRSRHGHKSGPRRVN